jgi:type VI secretion system secreted protein Hcp
MAFDTFIVFTPNHNGETQDDKFKAKGASEIHSFSFGAHNPTTVGSQGSGLAGGKVALSTFNFLKKVDTSSPGLFLACCEGKHFDQVTVVLRKSGGKALEFLEYEMKNVMVENIQFNGSSGGDDTPTESVTLAYGSIKIDYQQQNKDGTALGGKKNAGWNQINNIKV